MSEAEAEIDAARATIEAWEAAIGRKDARAALALMSADIVEYNLAPPLQARKPSEEGYGAWFATWDGPIGFEMRDLVVECSGTIGFAHALVRMTGTKTDGSTSDLWFRESFGLRKEGEGWIIAHVHDSVPFYMDGSFKAAVDLSPRVRKV